MFNGNKVVQLITGQDTIIISQKVRSAPSDYSVYEGRPLAELIYQSIREWIETHSSEELDYVMYRAGYSNSKEPIITLNMLLETPVYEWIGLPNRKSTLNFLRHMVIEMGISDSTAVQQFQGLSFRCNAQWSIWIYTGFDRRNRDASIMALCLCERYRRIRISSDLQREAMLNGVDSIVPIIRSLIVDHYAESGGILTMWGTIQTYIFYDASAFSPVSPLALKFAPDGSDAQQDVKIFYPFPH